MKPFNAPQDFTAKFPNYVYRSGKGQESVQWREAALDMANDRAKLVAALKRTIPALISNDCPVVDDVQNLLRELGEE